MSGNPTSTSIPQVDGLSTDPPVLGRHNCNVVPCAHQFCNRKCLLSNTSWIEIYGKEFVLSVSYYLTAQVGKGWLSRGLALHTTGKKNECGFGV